MKKSVSLAFCFSLLLGCQEESVPSPSIEENDIPTKESSFNYTIPVDSALANLYAFLDSEEQTTRSNSSKKIANVLPINKCYGATRSTLSYEEENPLIYIANFENEEGFAVLAADERIPEKVIAVTEQGNLTESGITIASAMANGNNDIYRTYPDYGPGFFTDEAYGDELFMNPNTVSLYIEDARDTLVGNFEYETAGDSSQSGEISTQQSSGSSQSDLLPIALCISYAMNSAETNSDPGTHTPLPDPGREDGGSGGGGSSSYVKTTTSDWRTLKRTASLLYGYSSWHQHSPFNDFYPERRSWILFGKKGKAPAGCFPLAISKLMTNFELPAKFVHNGVTVNWAALKNKYVTNIDKQSAAALLAGISVWCDSWYFYQGTFTFPNKAKACMRNFGFNNVYSHTYHYEFVTDMIDKNKPLIIYAVPSYHINNSHSWIIDGYKIRERTITTTTVKNDVIVSSTSSTETCNMVHCDYGFGGYANGYYISGIFKLNDTNSEKDFIDDSSNDKTHYNNYIHLITYDLP